MNAATQRRLSLPLAILAVALGGFWLAGLAGLGRSVHWDPPRTTVAPQAAPGRTATLPRPPPLERYAAVWTHPLFDPQRRPQLRGTEAQSLGELALTGIILTPGLHMALLRGRDDVQVRVREGEALPDGSATLVALEPRAAIFEGPGGRLALTLPAGAPIDPPSHTPPPSAAVSPPPSAAPGTTSMVVAGGDSPDRREARPPRAAADDEAARLERLKASLRQRRALPDTPPAPAGER